MKKKLILPVIICLLTQLACTQNIDKAKLDTYFEALENNNKFMGSVAISQNGKLLYSKSVGFADIEKGLKPNENSKYRIGSISKTFTSVLVLKAVEEKKLQLDQTIDNYFPTIVNAGKITISQLLYHRSGIPNFTDDKSYMDWNTQPKTEQEMIDIISGSGSVFEPNSKTSYSNSNYVLLSYILEKVYKKPYSKLIDEKITKPVGLVNTYLGGKIDINKKECYSYAFKESSWKKESETDISIPLGAGGIVSTPVDLIKFGNALFHDKLVSQNSLEQMKTIKDMFGMGLIKMPFYEQTGYGHTGGIDGFNSMFVYFPDNNISAAYTANGINYMGNDIMIVLLSAVYGKPFEIPEFKTYEVTTEDLDQYLGVYSSVQLPLKLTITKDNKTLVAQGTGQPSFPLDAFEKDKFRFDRAGVILEFNPSQGSMILKQGGGTFTFTKEK